MTVEFGWFWELMLGMLRISSAFGLSIGWVNSIRQGVVRQITNISR
jgi:hypothetical protein